MCVRVFGYVGVYVVHVYICIYMHVYIYMYMYIYVYMYIPMYVHVYAYTYTYTHTHVYIPEHNEAIRKCHHASNRATHDHEPLQSGDWRHVAKTRLE